MLRFIDAKNNLRTKLVSINKRDGEYRVSLMELCGRRAEDCAYYTDDLDDAYMTGLNMRRRAPLNLSIHA